MEQHRLIKWLKFLVIFAAGCGMVMDLGVLPGVDVYKRQEQRRRPYMRSQGAQAAGLT